MSRARNIKPGFFRNADLVELSMEARLLFIGLWTLADREGRLEDRPKQIKMEIFPADSVDCDALLGEIAATDMLARYEVDGKRYLQIVNFKKHQNPHKDEKASTVPDQCGNIAPKMAAPSKHGASTVQAPCESSIDTVPIRLNPDPRILIPDPGILKPDPLTGEGEAQAPARPSMAGAICLAMKAEGMASVNPQHPKLLVLIDKGADVGLFASVARECVEKHKNFGYLLATVEGRMSDAAALAATALALPSAKPSQIESFAAQDQRMKRRAWEEMTGEAWPADDNANRATALVIDITETTKRIA